jgi:hypothetical protein
MYAVDHLNMTVPQVAIYSFIGGNGSISVDPQTGAVNVMERLENTWQNMGTLPGEPLGGVRSS